MGLFILGVLVGAVFGAMLGVIGAGLLAAGRRSTESQTPTEDPLP